ncbi:MAG: nicotinate-nucleotide adenylyltransferase [Clostridiales bacterium]|nr:nicotinate-nucleotide adenylyltransferase [Clostridiales bacterium]
MMKKIGIMGGTFNPIHNGHIKIALAAYEQYALNQVLFLPNRKPPHKKNTAIASNQARLEMISLAISPYPFFSISNSEMKRDGFSYTCDTLLELKEKESDADLYFIIGADSLHDMEHWYRPEQIFQLAYILCAPRYPNTKEEDHICRKRLISKYKASVDFIQMEPLAIASREIVGAIQYGKSIEGKVPKTVERYLMEHNVYPFIKERVRI